MQATKRGGRKIIAPGQPPPLLKGRRTSGSKRELLFCMPESLSSAPSIPRNVLRIRSLVYLGRYLQEGPGAINRRSALLDQTRANPSLMQHPVAHRDRPDAPRRTIQAGHDWPASCYQGPGCYTARNFISKHMLGCRDVNPSLVAYVEPLLLLLPGGRPKGPAVQYRFWCAIQRYPK